MEYLVETQLNDLSFVQGLTTGVLASFLIPIFYNVSCRFFTVIYHQIWGEFPSEVSEDTEDTVKSKDVDDAEDEIQSAISQTRRKRRKRKRDTNPKENLSTAMESLLNAFPVGESPIAKILSELPSSTEEKIRSEEHVDLAEEMKNLSGYMMRGFQPSDSEDLQNGFSELLSDLPRIAEEIKSNPTIQEMKSLISKGEFTGDDFRKMQEGMSGLMSSVLNGKISEEEIEEQKQDSEVVLRRLNEIKMSDSETMD